VVPLVVEVLVVQVEVDIIKESQAIMAAAVKTLQILFLSLS
jgi:hypothetical protein